MVEAVDVLRDDAREEAAERVKSKRWQRSTTVGRTLCASVVARTKIVDGGGSSSVLRNAFQAWGDSMCASSRM